MTITPEVRTELLEMLRQELAQEERRKKENRTAYRRVCKEFEQEMAAYDYVETHSGYRNDGSRWESNTRHNMSWKIRDAVGTLLRAVYQVDAIAKLPEEHEQDMKEFMANILQLMKSFKDEHGNDKKTS
jgi:hypothetical protein